MNENNELECIQKSIHELSIKYTSDTDKKHLKQFGQFFTLSKDILSKLITFEQNTHINILEPSCGTGSIILECIKHFQNFSLDAIEIDETIYNKTIDLFKDKYNTECHDINFYNQDFFKYNFDKKYDLIIGNPPYFEITKDHRKLIQSDFNEILNGRTNMYSLFIHKSIQLLNDNGQLIFVLPKSILSGKYFSKLRTYIHKHCNILDIIKFDDNNLFHNALQSVIILKLQKKNENNVNDNNKFIQVINNEIYFVKNLDNLNLNIQTTLISKLDCIVKTGNIVWNQHKDNLSNIKTDNSLQLIKSSNIKNGILKLNLDTTNDKKQFLLINDKNKHLIIHGPYILINRIVGLNPPKLNIYFERNDNDNTKCFIENHVNYIKGSIGNLTKIYNSLQDKKTIEFIKELIGNTQLSQYELENIIPIFN